MRHNRERGMYLVGLALGTAAGVFFASCVIIGLLVLRDVGLLDQYQTLIGVFVALVAAGLPLWLVSKQIYQVYEIAGDQRERSNYAARALMPMALAALSDYAAECLRMVVPFYWQAPNPLGRIVAQGPLPPQPPIPTETIAVFRDCILMADDSPRLAAAELLAKLQIQHSRFRTLRSRLSGREQPAGFYVTRDNINQAILDALEVYARTSLLFDYARRATEDVAHTIEPRDMVSAANNHDIDDEDFVDVHQMIERRFPQPIARNRQLGGLIGPQPHGDAPQ